MSRNQKLNLTQFIDALFKVHEQAISGSNKHLNLFSNIVYSLMPNELIEGDLKELGEFIFKIEIEFMPLFTNEYISSQKDLDIISHNVKSVLSVIKEILLRLSNNKEVLNEPLVILKKHYSNMLKIKKEKFVYIGKNTKLYEKLIKLDELKAIIQNYLEEKKSTNQNDLLHSVRRELYEGGSSLLGLLDSLIKGRSIEESNNQAKLFSEKQVQYQFRIVILSLLQKAIRDHNYTLKGFGEEIENLINQGIISNSVWQLYLEEFKNDNVKTEYFSCNQDIQFSEILNERYQISNLVEWARKVISNTIGIPYLKGCIHVVERYQRCITLINEEILRTQEHMSRVYVSVDDTVGLREKVITLKKHSLQVFSSEYKQKMGRSLKDLSEVKQYQNSKNKMDLLKIEVRSLMKRLPDNEGFEDDFKRNLLFEHFLIVINSELKKLIVTLDKHLDVTLPKHIRQLLSDTDYQSLKIQLENVFMRCSSSIEDYSFNSIPHCPIFHCQEKITSNAEIEELCLSLDKQITLFKRPAGSLSVEQLLPDDIENILKSKDTKEFRIKLRNMIEYLETQKLKSRQLTMIPFPGKGAGGYDKFTNTLIIPSYKSIDKNNIYFALSDYIYTTMIKSRADAPVETLYDTLGDKIKPATARKQKDIVTTKVLKSLIREMTESNSPSGLSEKVVKSFMKYLDPPNDLIIFRDVINVPPFKRDSFLEGIMAKYQIKNTKVFLSSLKTFLIDKYYQPELEKKTTIEALKCLTEDMEIYQKISLFDDIYDAGVILFDKAMLKESFVLFHSLLEIGSKESAILWNLATFIRFHRFNGIEKIIKKPKEFCSQCYLMFEKSTDLSEYWKMKARKLRMSMGE